MKHTIMLAISCLSLCSSALAQERDCSRFSTQTDLSQCAYWNHQKIEAELTVVYRQVMSALSEEEKVLLRASQRAWITYKDKTCEFDGAGRRGGSMQGMVISMCLTAIIRERVKFLNSKTAEN